MRSGIAAVSRRQKVREWVRRYGVAECVGISCALIGSTVVRKITHSVIAAGYGGAWGESIGYGGTIIARDFLSESRQVRAARRSFRLGDVWHVITNLLTEFGPAALLDTFVTRPLAMSLGLRLLGAPLGVIAGKLCADVVFYVPVIFMYERRQRRSGR